MAKMMTAMMNGGKMMLAEQYDSLLKLLSRHSLKEETALWEDFQNLKQARNTFVHEGAARVGKVPVDAPRAAQLIRSATQIILKIREWLPQHLRWSTFEQKVEIVITKAIDLPAAATECRRCSVGRDEQGGGVTAEVTPPVSPSLQGIVTVV